MDLRERLQGALGSAYTVERELGGGGMSRVFLARETALGRNVVVKVLSSELVAGLSVDRFAREVRLAASLQHPNIVPVLTAGTIDGIPYYTMPYVRGESLREMIKRTPAIPRREALSLLRDVARALQYAHAEGVIHRDIKPENVLISGDIAVVTDFGIAKAISLARTSTPDGSSTPDGDTLTQAGSVVGTPAYMAPEQVVGDELDNRTDIYSWGILAYEVLACAHPFSEKTGAPQLLSAQVAQRPVPLSERVADMSPQVNALVMQCVEKNPDARPSSATEIVRRLDTIGESTQQPIAPVAAKQTRFPVAAAAAALLGLLAIGSYFVTKSKSPSAPPDVSSVAVLPFADAGSDSVDAYFGEGVADELMTALGKVPGLRVASRTSAIAVARRRDLDVKQIGSQLGVSTVVEGTVRRAGGHLRVTAQLTNAADGLTLWSETYDRESKDVFAVQDDIAKAIVSALGPEFSTRLAATRSKRPAGPGTTNPAAYDLYLRGLYLLERRGPGVAQAAKYFTEAIHQDTSFARAYAGLADALELFPYFAGASARSVEARARSAAQKSLQLDPTLAEPRVALAMAYYHAYRWTEADAEFKSAILADSTSSVAHTQYCRFLFIINQLRPALDQCRIARSLDPLAPTAYVWLSHVLSLLGDSTAAWEISKAVRELDPTLTTAYVVLTEDRIALGHFDEARSMLEGKLPPLPFSGWVAYDLERIGDTARAAAIRRTLESTPDTTWLIHTARAYAYLGMRDTARALSEMESGLDHGEIVPVMLPMGDRQVDVVRHTARFAAIVKRVGLEGRGLTEQADHPVRLPLRQPREGS